MRTQTTTTKKYQYPAMTPKDKIECRFSVPQIRQLFATYLAGMSRRSEYEDVPTCFKKEAGLTPIDVCVEELAKVWEKWNK